jgi:urate oxidase
MALVSCTYGKSRVRVLRVHKEGAHHAVRELTVQAMLEGAFAGAFVAADNSLMVSTDTVKNVVNIVAGDYPGLDTEAFCAKVAERLLESYPQVATATVTGEETKWTRLNVAGAPHPHSFVLDGNGRPFATVVATRAGTGFARDTTSGISGFTFMKTTASGWDNFYKDPYTTLPETRERICATALDARWRWSGAPQDYSAANALILTTMLDVFASTYSESVQDSLYRMGMAALDAVPEVRDIHLAAPNKHYLLANLAPFGMTNENTVFVATDEPHGQIECMVGRD